ncbi:MAG TPA: TIGR01212 family radical SAM protein, partial [Acholeplasmataceae bacterium]|nr:TIGR01212 family radical SAM protein [Acholeplasmataceae bacterium]
MILLTKEKHYNTLNNYYRKTYGQKVFKVALNAGFTCPNIDGTVASGGCTFCSWMGSGDFAGDKRD